MRAPQMGNSHNKNCWLTQGVARGLALPWAIILRPAGALGWEMPSDMAQRCQVLPIKLHPVSLDMLFQCLHQIGDFKIVVFLLGASICEPLRGFVQVLEALELAVLVAHGSDFNV